MRVKRILAHTARTLLALTFLFSGFVKAIDPLGTVYKIEDYLKAFGGVMTELIPLASLAAACLILAECVLGATMLMNVRTRWTSWLSLLFYMVMTPLTLWIALTNPVSDCGCFGDAIVLTNWQTFWKNIVLLTLVIVLLCTKDSLQSRWKWYTELSIAVGTVIAVLALMAWTQRHLPLMDFRPYKIGNNLPELMEGGKPAVYDFVFTYEKDGVQREFKADNLPSKEEGWVYVDREDILIEEGIEAPVHDLDMTRLEDGENILEDVLESDEPITLIVMYDLNKSNMSLMDKVLALIEADPEHTFILTGSGSEEIEPWLTTIDQEALPMVEQAMCMVDPVTLKTIVRANPGVVVLRNGNVIDKYNLRNR